MSFNRLTYDTCAYKHSLAESVGTLSWVLDPSRFENCNKCRIEFGTVGGTNVSHIKGNLVDLETELRGTTRLQSKCPTLKYQNPCPSGEMTTCQPDEIVIKANPSNSGKILNLEHVHLGSCQLAKYKPTILPEKMEPVKCNYY